MSIIVAIDHGNNSIKTENEEFPSGLADSLGMDGETIEYKGRTWALSGKRLPFQRDKTLNDDYFVLTLFAIAREMDELDAEIDLAVGLPPEYIKTEREKFEKYFLEKGNVKFKYNGVELIVKIRKVWVFPQAYAATMTKRELLKSKARIFVVDVGGMTVDTLLLQDLKPDMGFVYSLRGGVNLLCNDIAKRVSAELGMIVTQGQVEDYLREKDDFLPNEVCDIIENECDVFVRRMIDDLRERDIDLQTAQGVFVGGGSLLLKEWIEKNKYVSKPVFVEDVKANAKGYKMFAEAMAKREA